MENKPNNIHVKISKFLSLILRHSSETVHLNMDKNGWVIVLLKILQIWHRQKANPQCECLIRFIKSYKPPK